MIEQREDVFGKLLGKAANDFLVTLAVIWPYNPDRALGDGMRELRQPFVPNAGDGRGKSLRSACPQSVQVLVLSRNRRLMVGSESDVI